MTVSPYEIQRHRLRQARPGHTPSAPPKPTARELEARIWHQVKNGLDVKRLLPEREKRARDLAKKLDREIDRNGWRMFVSGCAYAMETGKAAQRRNAEVALVDAVTRWHAQVIDLLPDREPDLRAIVAAGLARPEPPQQQRP